MNYSDLELLYDQVPQCERSLYEIIPENQRVKAYIDFEYPIDNNRSVDQTKAIDSCLKVLYTILNRQSQYHLCTDVSMEQLLEQFLVLQAQVIELKRDSDSWFKQIFICSSLLHLSSGRFFVRVDQLTTRYRIILSMPTRAWSSKTIIALGYS